MASRKSGSCSERTAKPTTSIFRPDGNDALGGIVACSEEAGLRATAVTAPIKMLIYNGSGSDIQLFKLDAEGKRVAYGAIGEDMTVPITTYVDSPWVIADASGKCLEIVLPGRHTRFHTVEAHSGARPSARAAAPFRWPVAKRCCANISRPWAAASRTTIA